MPNRSQGENYGPSPVEAITAAGTEPDVTWGSGGIDDWGWTAVEAAPDEVDAAKENA